MSVWYVVPSKRPPEQCEPVFQRWRDMGYNVLVQRDPGELLKITGHIQRPYAGYAEAVNYLVRHIFACEDKALILHRAEWIVTGGDDILPDPNKRAEDIARECAGYFMNLAIDSRYPGLRDSGVGGIVPIDPCLKTFGVMQPTGDAWGDNEAWARQRYPEGRRRYIERVLGSPWMGREWCRRMYGGHGPLCEEYFHMFEDEEHQCVAERMGVLWQRRDLTHMHQHYSRTGQPLPAFLARATSGEHWKQAQTIFERRRAAGFPGHEPIA